MKGIGQLLWVLFIGTASAVCLWIVAGPWKPEGKLAVGLIVALFALGSFGNYWMLYQAIRYEKRPAKFIMLVFFAFAFVWYYFNRYRTRLSRSHYSASGEEV